MAREIERKFLVARAAWEARLSADPVRGTLYRQGYLSVDPDRIVRVRISGGDGWLTVKGRTRGLERAEFEYAIPADDATRMLNTLCLRPLIEKTRYRVEYAGHTWDVDVFHGDNDGLMVAEIELAGVDDAFDAPDWVGHEVSGDPRYFNASLIAHPYKAWRDDD